MVSEVGILKSPGAIQDFPKLLIGYGWVDHFEGVSLPQCIHICYICWVHLRYCHIQWRKWRPFPWLFPSCLVRTCPVNVQISASIFFVLVIFHMMSLLHCRYTFWTDYGIREFFLGLMSLFPWTCIRVLWMLGRKIDVLVLSVLSLLKYSFLPVGLYSLSFILPSILWC